MGRKFIINPDKYIYDTVKLNEYLKLNKIIKDLCTKVPDSEWTSLDAESLMTNISKLFELAKELTKGRIKR